MKKHWYRFIIWALDVLIEGTSKDIVFHQKEMDKNPNDVKWAQHFMSNSELSKRLIKMQVKRHMYAHKLNQVLQK